MTMPEIPPGRDYQLMVAIVQVCEQMARLAQGYRLGAGDFATVPGAAPLRQAAGTMAGLAAALDERAEDIDANSPDRRPPPPELPVTPSTPHG